MKAALAIGGTSAFMAAKVRAHDDPVKGTTDFESLPDRQFAWNDYLSKNETTGLAKPPRHHLQLMLDYAGDGTPTDAEREQVETALRTLERAFEWSNEGMVFTIGYSGAYFDRYDEDLPDSAGLRPPEDIIQESDIAHSGRIDAEHYDAHLHLASDAVVAPMEAEEMLFGNVTEVNDVDVAATFEGVFEKRDRRTGFLGNPHEQWEENIPGKNPVDEDAPVWFGFASLFQDSQASEDEVTIDSGPFADGTTEQVSVLLDNNIREWYERNNLEERVNRMFSPHHAVTDTGEHARKLGMTSGTDEETMAALSGQTKADAEELGVVGHAQKMARARKDGRPLLMRRDFPSTDDDQAKTQFISNQRTIDDFIHVRKHMGFVKPEENEPAESEVELKDHGIQGYFMVQSRATFLLPSRNLRALPPARP